MDGCRENKKTVLVTGATGFIGRSLVVNLLNERVAVYVLSRREKPNADFAEKVRVVRADITDEISVPLEISTIYHCAGVISQEDQMVKVNVYGTQRIVDAALKQNCRLIHLSSAGVVGRTNERSIVESTKCHPQDLYERTKFEAERIVMKGVSEGLKAQILRPTIVFGNGRDPAKDSFLHLIRAIKSGRYKSVRNGKGIYNIIHVNEVVRAMHALDNDDISNGGVYFLNSPISFNEFSSTVAAALSDKGGTVDNIPYALAFMAAVVFSAASAITGIKVPLTLTRLKALTNEKLFSQKRLLEKTSYHPLWKVEDYIKQICKEYAEKGLLD